MTFSPFGCVAGEDGPGEAARKQEDRQRHSQYLCLQVSVCIAQSKLAVLSQSN